MKIQDVLSKDENGQEKERIYAYHREVLQELKAKSEQKKSKVEKKDDVDRNLLKNDENVYLENMQRIKAANIVSRISKGEDVGESEKNFVNTRYPDMINQIVHLNKKVEEIFDKIDKIADKQTVERVIQTVDGETLNLPFGDEGNTVFEVLVDKVSKK